MLRENGVGSMKVDCKLWESTKNLLYLAKVFRFQTEGKREGDFSLFRIALGKLVQVAFGTWMVEVGIGVSGGCLRRIHCGLVSREWPWQWGWRGKDDLERQRCLCRQWSGQRSGGCMPGAAWIAVPSTGIESTG